MRWILIQRALAIALLICLCSGLAEGRAQECGDNPMKQVLLVAKRAGRSLTHVLTLLRDIDGGAYDTLSQKFRLYAACVGLVDTGYFRKRSGATLPMVNVHSNTEIRKFHDNGNKAPPHGHNGKSIHAEYMPQNIETPQEIHRMYGLNVSTAKDKSHSGKASRRREMREWLLQIQAALQIRKYHQATKPSNIFHAPPRHEISRR